MSSVGCFSRYVLFFIFLFKSKICEIDGPNEGAGDGGWRGEDFLGDSPSSVSRVNEFWFN